MAGSQQALLLYGEQAGGFPSGPALMSLLHADEPVGSPSLADFTLIGNGNLATSPGSVAGSNWYIVPNIAGIGAGYWARLDVVSGAAPTVRPGADGTLINIGGGVGIRWYLRRDAAGTTTAVWRLRIYSDAAGVTMVSDTTFDVEAVVFEPGVTYPTGSALVTRIQSRVTFPAEAAAWITLNPNGSISTLGNETICSAFWRDPLSTGIGANFWMRLDVLSGPLPDTNGTTPANTILQLNVARGFNWNDLAVGTVTANCRLTIARDSALTDIVSQADFPVTTIVNPSVAGPINNYGGTEVAYFRNAATAVAAATFNSDGTCVGSGVASVDTDTLTGTKWYSTAPVGGIGAGYWILVTPISGTLSSNSASSWVSLASNQSFSVSQATAGSKVCTARVDIAASAGGTILATGNVLLIADRS